MSQRFSTAGMTLKYCVETTAGTRPTASFTEIPEVKTVPDLNPAPNGIDVTPLSETAYVQYVDGLKDVGGVLEFTANLTEDLITAWSTLISAYNTGIAADKETWFAVVHPSLTQAVYFTGKPVPLGLSGAEVGSALETTLYIAPSNAPAMYTKPT